MLQVPSSQIILDKFAANPDDPIIQREKQRFDDGFLTAPELVGEWIMDFVRSVKDSDQSLVFSGSPRTVPEGKVELEGLNELFGLQRVFAVHLRLDEKEARRRIAGRRLCRANKHPIPGTPEFASLTVCPKDGSELYVRPLDDASKLDERFREYTKLTEPTIDLLRNAQMPFFEVDGGQSIEALHQEIAAIIERRQTAAPLE
jgi:adenylate kinase family enzyme